MVLCGCSDREEFLQGLWRGATPEQTGETLSGLDAWQAGELGLLLGSWLALWLLKEWLFRCYL